VWDLQPLTRWPSAVIVRLVLSFNIINGSPPSAVDPTAWGPYFKSVTISGSNIVPDPEVIKKAQNTLDMHALTVRME
jgi:hypothetical protein